MQRVTINGATLAVDLTGPDGAPLIIVHHGAPGLGSHAEPKLSFGPLADTYRVLVFDARGSGASDLAPPFTHAQWVADVEALRAWAGAERFVMAGGSYGGFIAMEYALAHPARVAALVLRDTAADGNFQPAAMHAALSSTRIAVDEETLRRILEGRVRDDADFATCWKAILPLYDYTYDPAKTAAQAAATPYHYATHNQAMGVNMRSYDLKPLLHRIACPTLITVGRHDWITPVACSETIARLIPDARLEIFEKSGHSPQIEQGEEFRARVRGFLAEALRD